MSLADYLYEVVDAIPGEKGGYANALVTLLGGDSRRQRQQRNLQAAMSLFGTNPSEQEIQAMAANEMQPAMPEGATTESYGPRLNQLQAAMQQNAPLVEAARMAGAGGTTPSLADIEKAWKLQQLRNLVGDERFTPEQQAQMISGEDISPYRPATGGIYNRYDGGFSTNSIGQSLIGANNALANDRNTAARTRQQRADSMGGVDQARINTLGKQGGYYDARSNLTNEQTNDAVMRRQVIERFVSDPNVDTLMKVDAAQKKKLGQTMQKFKVVGPDGKAVWATGTLGADGRPILTPSTMEIPPNADGSKSYEWQSVDAALQERFPNSTPQDRIAYIKGSDMERARIMRDWRDQAEQNYDQDVNDPEVQASSPAPLPVPNRAPRSAAVGGKPKVSPQQKQRLIQQANEAIRQGKDPKAVERMLQSLLGE